jgi:uncharacterized membrane protein YeiB
MAKQTSKTLVFSIIGLIVIVAVVAVVLVVRHDNKTLSPSQQTAAKQQIETNWKEFFAASTTLQGRENLLQNGSEFSQLIQGEFTELASQASSAIIASISFTNKTSANVEYTVDLNGQPVLSNEKGEALLTGSSWKVSDSTLCYLIGLSGSKPAVCKNY